MSPRQPDELARAEVPPRGMASAVAHAASRVTRGERIAPPPARELDPLLQRVRAVFRSAVRAQR